MATLPRRSGRSPATHRSASKRIGSELTPESAQQLCPIKILVTDAPRRESVNPAPREISHRLVPRNSGHLPATLHRIPKIELPPNNAQRIANGEEESWGRGDGEKHGRAEHMLFPVRRSKGGTGRLATAQPGKQRSLALGPRARPTSLLESAMERLDGVGGDPVLRRCLLPLGLQPVQLEGHDPAIAELRVLALVQRGVREVRLEERPKPQRVPNDDDDRLRRRRAARAEQPCERSGGQL